MKKRKTMRKTKIKRYYHYLTSVNISYHIISAFKTNYISTVTSVKKFGLNTNIDNVKGKYFAYKTLLTCTLNFTLLCIKLLKTFTFNWTLISLPQYMLPNRRIKEVYIVLITVFMILVAHSDGSNLFRIPTFLPSL